MKKDHGGGKNQAEERKTESNLQVDPCIELEDQEWPWKLAPEPLLAIAPQGEQVVMSIPNNKLSYHVPCTTEITKYAPPNHRNHLMKIGEK